MIKNIKRICKQKGVRISALESAAGLPRGSIYKWDENTPSVLKVAKVAEVLGITVDEIIYEKEE